MGRAARTVVLLTLAVAVALLPALSIASSPANAASCSVLGDAESRLNCEVRAASRAEADARVAAMERDAATGTSGGHGAGGGPGAVSTAWDRAVADAKDARWRDQVGVRDWAAVIGTVWFWLALRSRLRSRQARWFGTRRREPS